MAYKNVCRCFTFGHMANQYANTAWVLLPCKPLVKQYLVNRYNITDNGLVQLPAHDWIKHLVKALVEKNFDRQNRYTNMDLFTCKVLIPIGDDDLFRRGGDLSPESVSVINNRIEDIIRQQLYQFLEFYVHAAGMRLNDAVCLFQQIYNFPEEVYRRATILKHYQRHIKPHLVLQKFVGVQGVKRPIYRVSKLSA